MSFKNLTWQQVVMIAILLGSTFAGFYFLGPAAGAFGAVATSLVAAASHGTAEEEKPQ